MTAATCWVRDTDAMLQGIMGKGTHWKPWLTRNTFLEAVFFTRDKKQIAGFCLNGFLVTELVVGQFIKKKKKKGKRVLAS